MIPDFPQFKTLELSDREAILEITSKFLPYSDFDFGSMWSWDYSGKMLISTLYGNFVMKFTDYITGDYFYTFIGSNSVNETAAELLQHAQEIGIQTELKLIPESVKGLLNIELFTIEDDPDNVDYIVSVSNLATYEGHELAAKRRAVSQFLRKAPESTFAVINLESRITRDQITNLFISWQEQKRSTGEDDNEHEFVAMQRCIDSSKNLELIATGLYIGDTLAAFWILGILGNGYSISHFEKADTKTYQGIFPYFKMETAKFLQSEGVEFINLEQDLGIEGLRQSKKAYAPVLFLKKYKIRRKSNI